MKKTILAAVPLALLALAAPAAAHGGKHATTLKAKFAPSADSSVRGGASLVDGKRRDRFRLRVKGLEAGATYSWSLRQAAGGGDACTGETVASFSSTSLEARRKGATKVRSRAKGFAAAQGVSYAVVITDEAGEDVACAELRTKAQRKAAKRKGSKQQQTGGDDERSGEDKGHFDEDEQGDDDDQGEDEDDLGEDDSAADEDDPSDDEDDEDEV